jgi:hypothetical protein
VGRNSAGSRAWPGQPILSPAIPRGPAETERPSRPPYPVHACSPVRPRGLPKPRRFPSSQGLGHAELTPRHRLPATELTPCSRLGCLCLVPRSCLPRLRPNARLPSSARQPQNPNGGFTPNETRREIILKSAMNMLRIFDSVGGEIWDVVPLVLDSLAYK